MAVIVEAGALLLRLPRESGDPVAAWQLDPRLDPRLRGEDGARGL